MKNCLLSISLVAPVAWMALSTDAATQDTLPVRELTEAERIAPEEVVRSQHHYREVEHELLTRAPAGLSVEQRLNRAAAIAELARYRDAADYPIRAVNDGVRRPLFEDADGRHCAVAHLMWTFGAADLVTEYAQTDNHAYIMELTDDARLAGWVDAMGLTMLEAARIHVPPPLTLPGASVDVARLGSRAPTTGGSSNTAGDSATSGASGTGSGPPVSAVPSSGATSGGSRARGRSQTGKRASFDEHLATISGNVYIEPWWEWWEMNKHQFLQPHPLIDAAPTDAPPSRYHFGARLTQRYIETTRDQVLPRILDETLHEDERVRARAAMALARLARKDAVPRLFEMLSDRSQRVCHAAILALGATGDHTAAVALVELAESGRIAKIDGDISPYAQALALVGLGIGRHYGMPKLVAGFADGIYQDAHPKRDNDIGAAAFLFDTLDPSDALQERAIAAVDDDTFDVATRCRAISTLGHSGNPSASMVLVRALDDSNLEIRRAAALALGGLHDEHILQRLMTSFEVEAEPMTRGFLLISIGAQETLQARDMLMRTLKRGDKPMRPWAALALGVYSRRTGDVEAMKAIRKALRADANHDQHGAYVIASGIALDVSAVPTMREMLIDSPDPRMRMFAASGLGLVDDAESRKILLSQLEDEPWSFARAAIAQSLGHIGHDDDGEIVVATLRDIRDPQLQSYVASAVGFHGSQGALEGLIRLLDEDDIAGEARAAAVDAIGLLLDGQPGMLMSDIASASNFRTFPHWMTELMGTVTL